MKKNLIRNIGVVGAIAVLIIATRVVESFPWWSFIPPVFIFGAIMGKRDTHIAGFADGFIAGGLVWAGANLFFHLYLDGRLLSRVAAMLHLTLPLLLILAGITGGLVTGLAFYSGQILFAKTSGSYAVKSEIH